MPEGYVVGVYTCPKNQDTKRPKDSPTRYAKIPATVLHDSGLSASARLVYAELALWVFQGSVTSSGIRRIADNLGFSKQTVSNGLDELIEAGVVTKGAVKPGRRAMYCLRSPVFAQKQGKETVVVSAPSGGYRYASVNREEIA